MVESQQETSYLTGYLMSAWNVAERAVNSPQLLNRFLSGHRSAFVAQELRKWRERAASRSILLDSHSDFVSQHSRYTIEVDPKSLLGQDF
jgi:hypothetical protein